MGRLCRILGRFQADSRAFGVTGFWLSSPNSRRWFAGLGTVRNGLHVSVTDPAAKQLAPLPGFSPIGVKVIWLENPRLLE
jgi:hypothetical protein